jgi:hypothetical protein
LETDVDSKYDISTRCARGILRRQTAGKRGGKPRPELLDALRQVAVQDDDSAGKSEADGPEY